MSLAISTIHSPRTTGLKEKDRISTPGQLYSDMNDSQCPTNVAPAVANAPQNKHEIPCSRILSFSNFKPAKPPCVCCVVLSVSIGVSSMRRRAAEREAARVLMRTGQVREAVIARIPALAAVSKNRERGPWKLRETSY
jgi:hypothetical protein